MLSASRVAAVKGTGLDGTRPRLSAAAIARATQVFPEPGSPESMAKVPEASLSCQSQSTGRSSISERQTRSAWRSVTTVEPGGAVGRGGMDLGSGGWDSVVWVSVTGFAVSVAIVEWLAAGDWVPGRRLKGRPEKVESPMRGLWKDIKDLRESRSSVNDGARCLR